MTALRQELRAPVSTALEQARRTEVPWSPRMCPTLPARPWPTAITVVPVSLAGVPLHFLILLGGVV